MKTEPMTPSVKPAKTWADAGLSIVRADEDCYDVLACGVNVGCIRKEREGFWSNRQWTIDGEPAIKLAGGVNGKTVKYAGYYTAKAAAAKLAMMKSGEVIAALCGGEKKGGI